MYRIIRYVDGIAETLKDSISNLEIVYSDVATAELETKKLNLDLILLDNDFWATENIDK